MHSLLLVRLLVRLINPSVFCIIKDPKSASFHQVYLTGNRHGGKPCIVDTPISSIQLNVPNQFVIAFELHGYVACLLQQINTKLDSSQTRFEALKLAEKNGRALQRIILSPPESTMCILRWFQHIL